MLLNGDAVAHHAPGRKGLLLVAVIASAVNLRTAVTSVGALMQELERGLGLTPEQSGLLTALPLLTFAVVGSQVPRLARRLGEDRVIMGAMAAMTLGLIARSLVSSPTLFLLATVLALTGGAVGNVALPAVIKRDFADRVGAMTAAYTTAMAIGQTLAAGLSVPVFTATQSSWRTGIGVWGVLSAAAVLPWLGTRSARRVGATSRRPAAPRTRAVTRSPTAWLITGFFATQSAQVFAVFGWFSIFLQEAGVPADTAGTMVASYSFLFIPLSLVVPLFAARRRTQRVLLIAPSLAGIGGYVGLLVLGSDGAWLWMILVGLANAAFPVVLVLFTTRTRSPESTASLAALSQTAGYLMAGCGPLLIGVLRRFAEGPALPMSFLIGVAVVQVLLGAALCRGRLVEDDLGAGRARAADRPRA
jgi:CP family cyanate transporter-like MFS transporter